MPPTTRSRRLCSARLVAAAEEDDELDPPALVARTPGDKDSDDESVMEVADDELGDDDLTPASAADEWGDDDLTEAAAALVAFHAAPPTQRESSTPFFNFSARRCSPAVVPSAQLAGGPGARASQLDGGRGARSAASIG